MKFQQTLAALLATLALVQPGTAAPTGAADQQALPLFGAGARDFERAGGKVVGVYVANWAPVDKVEALPSGSVTHILYAFVRACGPGQLAKDAPKCVGKQDFQLGSGPVDQRFDAAFAKLKARAPHVSVLASVGGWGGSDPFFHFANDPARRAVFAASAAQFLREHPAFDGIDIDWEHPGGNGAANGVQLGSPADGQGYADLMIELRRTLDALTAETGRLYQLTTAVNPIALIAKRINFQAAAPALDLIFMMSYDFYGGWSPTVGHHSTLAASATGADDNLQQAVANLRAAGVPASKLVAGVAMYGRGFAGASSAQTGASKTGAFPGADGSLGYKEIAARYLDRRGQALHGYQTQLDAQTQAWSLFHPKLKLYIGYDDPRAVIAKGRYAREAGLAGLFAWEWSQDNGDLLNAMNLGVGNLPLPR
ncbi:glycoside hydrolase family 18 protein [Paucibacter sp. APW11]|uniref:chitinase n=1 Tax=Roseateles aquae TaxID=3077235 RepID=A0ABU3PBN3_9BURK|nr:glycoside hydrolase family 18 protein [Paucibacter sp. APW11]MDT8999976.1 glycoside hydrolase family 18 protein [Paucibacter sp. APW11]